MFFSIGKAQTFYFHIHYNKFASRCCLKTFPPPLSAEEELYYIRKYIEGDLEAKHILIERNLRLVTHILKKYQQIDTDSEDLISIGTIGLMKAVVTFDPHKNNRLCTYAARCIENAILSQMRLWLRIDLLREKKNQNGVFLRKLPRICISFAGARTAM